jgi:hypothetical protein
MKSTRSKSKLFPNFIPSRSLLRQRKFFSSLTMPSQWIHKSDISSTELLRIFISMFVCCCALLSGGIEHALLPIVRCASVDLFLRHVPFQTRRFSAFAADMEKLSLPWSFVCVHGCKIQRIDWILKVYNFEYFKRLLEIHRNLFMKIDNLWISFIESKRHKLPDEILTLEHFSLVRF